MTAADWGAIAAAAAAFLSSLAAYLHSRTTRQQLRAHQLHQLLPAARSARHAGRDGTEDR
jgi:hypothetical protein